MNNIPMALSRDDFQAKHSDMLASARAGVTVDLADWRYAATVCTVDFDVAKPGTDRTAWFAPHNARPEDYDALGLLTWEGYRRQRGINRQPLALS